MASSTLVVTLQGLQISNVQQVVTARGIDRVLVVDTASGFNSSAGIAAITGANGLRKAKAGSATELSDEPVSLAFAFAGGETAATISPRAYQALDSSGFAFVNDPSMSSFSSTVVLEADALNQAGSRGIRNAESAMALTRDLGSGVGASSAELESLQEALASTQLFNGFGAAASTFSVAPDVSFATAPTFTISGGGAVESGVLSDLKGTIKVNLSATEFAELARSKAQVKLEAPNSLSISTDVAASEPLTAADVPLSSLQLGENVGDELAGLKKTLTASTQVPLSSQVSGTSNLLTSRLSTADNPNSIVLTTADLDALFTANQYAGNWNASGENSANDIGKYVFDGSSGSVTLTPSQFLALPFEGVQSYGEVTLSGNAAAVTYALEESKRLNATGRFATINKINIVGSGDLKINADTFAELDKARATSSLDSKYGVTAISRDDYAIADGGIVITAGSNSLGYQNFSQLRSLGITRNEDRSTSGLEQDTLNLDGSSAVGSALIANADAIEVSVSLNSWVTNTSERASAAALKQSLEADGNALRLVQANTETTLSNAQQFRTVLADQAEFGLQLKNQSISFSDFGSTVVSNGSGTETVTNLSLLFRGAQGHPALTASELAKIKNVSGSAGSVTLDADRMEEVLTSVLSTSQRLFRLEDSDVELKEFIAAASAPSPAFALSSVYSIARTDSNPGPLIVDVEEFKKFRSAQANGLQVPDDFFKIVDTTENLNSFFDSYFVGTSLVSGISLSSLATVETDDGGLIELNVNQLQAVNRERQGRDSVDFAPETFVVVDSKDAIQSFVSTSSSQTSLANYDLTLVSKFAQLVDGQQEAYFPEIDTTQVERFNSYLKNESSTAASDRTQARQLADGLFNVKDTSSNIAELFVKATDVDSAENALDLSFLHKFTGSGSTSETVEISYQQFLALRANHKDGTEHDLFGAGLNALNGQAGLVNIEFVVLGTAEELESLFALDVFRDGDGNFFMEAGISFKITDGGEVTLDAGTLDVLEGRIEGQVIVADTTAGISQVLDNAIPDVVKSFVLTDDSGNVIDVDGDGSLDGDTIALSVGELANLPAYLDSNVILRDTDENIERRLRADLDYRVSKIEVSGSTLNTETKVEVRLGQLERLLENGVAVDPSITLVLHGADTLEVNAKGVKALPQGFQGSLVIVDDGDALRHELFDGTWNIPGGATDVQLRSLDNAPLKLSVAELSELASDFPGFSGAIALVDSVAELSNYIDGDQANIDSRVVQVAVDGQALGLPLNPSATQVDLSVADYEALTALETQIGTSLFTGSITLSEATAPRVASYTDARLEFTVNQQGAGGGGSLDVVTVDRFLALVADPTTPSDFDFNVVDTSSKLQALLSDPANVPLLARVLSLTSSQSPSLSLNKAQWENLATAPSVQVENLTIEDVAAELLESGSVASLAADARIDRINVSAPMGQAPAPAELSLADFGLIASKLGQASLVLTGDPAQLVNLIRKEDDQRIVGIKPQDASGNAVPLVISSEDLYAIIEDERFANSSLPITVETADSSAFVLDAEAADALPTSVNISGDLTIQDTAEDIAGLISIGAGDALDARITALQPTNTNRLTLSMAQVNNLPAGFDNPIVVSDSVENILSELTLDSSGQSELDGRIQAFDLLNGSSITLSAEQFESLRNVEARLGYELLSGPLNIRGLAGEEGLIGGILDLQDSRVDVVSTPGIQQLQLTYKQLLELGDEFTGSVVLSDTSDGIIRAFSSLVYGGSVDSRVVDIQVLPDDNGNTDLILDAQQINFLPSFYQGRIVLNDTEGNVKNFVQNPINLVKGQTLQLDADLLNVLTNRSQTGEFAFYNIEATDSYLVGSGSVVVTGIDDTFFDGNGTPTIDQYDENGNLQEDVVNPAYKQPNQGLVYLPRTFESIELVVSNSSVLKLDDAPVDPNSIHASVPDYMTRIDLLGAFMDRRYGDMNGVMGSMPADTSGDKITLSAGQSLQMSAGDSPNPYSYGGQDYYYPAWYFEYLKDSVEGVGTFTITDWYPTDYAQMPAYEASHHTGRDISMVASSLNVVVQPRPGVAENGIINLTELKMNQLVGAEGAGIDKIELDNGLFTADAVDASKLHQYITDSTIENQVTTLSLSGSVASGDVVTATIGGLSVSATAAGTSLSAVASDLAAAIGANASFSGVISAAVSGSEITLTADQAKTPFTAVAVASTSSVSFTQSDLAVSDYQLLVNGYNGEDISELADNLDVIHVNVDSDQTLVASNLPHDDVADLQIAITADVSLSADDSVLLQDKFVHGTSELGTLSNAGNVTPLFTPGSGVSTVTITDYTNQDVRRELWYATSGAQYGVMSGSTATTTPFHVDVEVASDADIVNAMAGTVAINPLLGVDHVMFDTDAHLTLNESQAEQLQTILRLDDPAATPQVTITNYTGADLSGIYDRQTQYRSDFISLSGTYEQGDLVEAVVNGVTVQVTAASSSLHGIFGQLSTAINAEPALSGIASAATAYTSSGLLVTSSQAGEELIVSAQASNRMAEKQISTITLTGTYDNGDEVSAIINGATITTTASSSDDLTTIATKLASAINASGVSGVVDASSSGAVINLMSDVAGSAFTVGTAASAVATPQVSTLTLSGTAEVGDTLQAVIAGQTVSVQATSANIGNLAADFVNELNTNSAVSGTIDAAISGNEIVIRSETAGAQFAITSTAIASSTLSSLSLSAPSTVNPTDGTSSSPAAVTATPVANVVEGADSQYATSFRANEFHDFAGQADITAVIESAVDFDSTATFSGLTGQLATNTSDIDTIELADTAELTLDEDQAELLKAKLTGVGDLVVENYTDVDLRVDDDASFGDIDVYVETVGTKQVSKLEFTGTGNVGDTVAAVINGQTVSVVATTANISNLASALAGEINGQPGLNGVVDASASGSVVTLSGAFGDAFAVGATAITTSGSSLSLASSGFADATKSDISVYGSENPFDGFDSGDQINIDGNDVFTLNVDQATDLFDNIRAQSAIGSELNGAVNVLGYDGRDLTELAQDAAANLDVTFNIDDQSFTASSEFVQNVAAADVINVVNGYALTLTADQASVLAGKLQGDGEVVITDYTTQDVSQIAAGLVVTLELDDANGPINTSDANFVARDASGVMTGQGVDFISIADNTELNLSDYSGVDLGTMITRGSGVTVNLSVDRPSGLLNGTDYSDSAERYLVDISSTANASNGGAGFLADVDSITINAGAELKIDDQSFSAVTSKLASDSGTGVSTGILHIGNIDPNTPLSAIHSQNPSLEVDVTLVPGARVDFTSGAGNLAEVRNIYLPTTSTLELTFGQAVTDRFPPALEENPDSISGIQDRYQYEFIKAVPGKQRGTLELDMQDYTSADLGSYELSGVTTSLTAGERAELQRVGLDGLLAQQAAGNFTLSLSIPSDVSLELEADDLAYFHEKLTGTGDLTVLNYTGEVINGLESSSATSSSMENLNSITIQVSAANPAVLTDDKFLPVLAQRSVVGTGLVTPSVDLVLNEGAQFTYLEGATGVTSDLSKYAISMASGSSFAVQADVADAFSYSTTAISTDSTVQLVGFDGTETLVDVKSTNARLNAVIGQVSTIGVSGVVTAGSAESVAITSASALSGITTLSVAAGSDLSLAAIDLPSGLEFGAIRGELRAPASTLDGYDVFADQVSLANLGTATGDVIVSGVTATSDLDGIAHGLDVVAEVSTAAANASDVQQVDTLTLSGSYVVGDVVSATINGTQVSVTANSANVSNMASALATQINSSAATSVVDATVSGDVITLTADNAGVAFDSSATVIASTATSSGAIAATTTTSNVVAFEFDAVGLSSVDEFALTDAGSFTATADELDAKKLTSTVAPSVTVNGYSSEDLSQIAAGFDVTVNVAGDATSTAAKLSSADAIEVGSGTALTISADDANTLGDKVDVSGVLNLTDYTTQNLNENSSAAPNILTTDGGQLKIEAVDGATLITSNLNAPVEIKVSGTDVTIDASEADAFGGTLTGSGLLSVTGYSDQNLSDIATSAVNVLVESGTVSTSTASNLAGNVDVITVEGDLTLTAGDAETLGDQLTGSGVLRASGYTNEDLSTINVAEQSFTVTQASTAQVSTLELSGSFATSSVVTAVVSGNTVTVTAASSDLAAIATQVATAINADAATDALVSAVVSGTGSTATVSLTSEQAGVGFDVSITSSTGVVSAATSTANLLVASDSSKLSTATELTIANGGVLEIDAVSADALATKLTTAISSTGNGRLDVTGYTGVEDVADLNAKFRVLANADAQLVAGNLGSVSAVYDKLQSVQIAAGTSMNATISAADAALIDEAKLQGDGALTITDYTGQDLRSAASSLTISVEVGGTAAVDSTAADLDSADEVVINSGFALNLSAADADTLGDKLSGSGDLNLANFLTADLSDISTSLNVDVDVTAVSGATASLAQLTASSGALTIDSLTVDGVLSIDALSATAVNANLAAGINGAGTLIATSYASEDLTGLTGLSGVAVKANADAALVASNFAGIELTTIDVASGSGTATISAIDADGFGSQLIGTGALDVSGYLTNNLSDILTSTVNVNAVSGATLIAANLTGVNAISIAGDVDATATDLAALIAQSTSITLGSATSAQSLSVADYVAQNLSSISLDSGAVTVQTSDVAVATLVGTALTSSTGAQFDVVIGAGNAVATAADAQSVASTVSFAGNTLTVDSYTTEDLSGFEVSGTLDVITSDGAQLTYAKLNDATSITLAGTATAAASELTAASGNLQSRIDVDQFRFDVTDYTGGSLTAITTIDSSVKQVDVINLTGSYEADDVVSAVINGVTVSATATTSGLTGAADLLAAAINNSSISGVVDATVISSGLSAATVQLTADTAGVAFTATADSTNRAAIKQVDQFSLAGTYEVGDVLSAVINGTTITTTAQSSGLTGVANALSAAINNSALSGVVDASATISSATAAVINLEAITAGVPFTSTAIATNRTAEQQVDTLTLSGVYEAGDVVSAVINGTTITTTATSSGLSGAATALTTAINGNSGLSAIVDASATISSASAAVITLSADAAGTGFGTTSAFTTGLASTAQVDTLTLSGTYDSGDVITSVINGSTITVTAASSSLAAIATQVSTALGSHADVSASVSGSSVLLTAANAGSAFSSSAVATNRPNEAQVDTLTLSGTIEASDVLNLTLNGSTLSTTLSGSGLSAGATELASAINTSSFSGIVNATASTAGVVTLTALSAGTAFTATVSTTDGGGNSDNTQSLTATTITAAVVDSLQTAAVTTTTANNLTDSSQSISFSSVASNQTSLTVDSSNSQQNRAAVDDQSAVVSSVIENVIASNVVVTTSTAATANLVASELSNVESVVLAGSATISAPDATTLANLDANDNSLTVTDFNGQDLSVIDTTAGSSDVTVITKDGKNPTLLSSELVDVNSIRITDQAQVTADELVSILGSTNSTTVVRAEDLLPQQNSITIGGVYEIGDLVHATIQGQTISVTAASSNLDAIASQVATAINAGPSAVTSAVTAAVSGAVVTVTANSAPDSYSFAAIGESGPSRKQVDEISLSGAYEAYDTVSAVINGVTIVATATSSGLTGAADALAAAINNSSISGVVDATVTSSALSAATIQLTADLAGSGFTTTVDSTNRTPIAQQDTFTLSGSYDVGDVVSAVINGETISVVAQTSALSSIASQLTTQINASGQTGAVTATSSGAVVTLDSVTSGVAFNATATATNYLGEKQVQSILFTGSSFGSAVTISIDSNSTVISHSATSISEFTSAISTAINNDPTLGAIVDASVSGSYLTLTADAYGDSFTIDTISAGSGFVSSEIQNISQSAVSSGASSQVVSASTVIPNRTAADTQDVATSTTTTNVFATNQQDVTPNIDRAFNSNETENAITITGYTGQDISGIDQTLYQTVRVNDTTAVTSTLTATKLGTDVDILKIETSAANGTGGVVMSASDMDTVLSGGASVTGNGSISITDYTNQDLSSIADSIALTVTVAAGSTAASSTLFADLGLDSNDQLVINGVASATGSDLASIASDLGTTTATPIAGSGSLLVGSYTGEDISAFTEVGMTATVSVGGTSTANLTASNLFGTAGVSQIASVDVGSGISASMDADLAATLGSKLVTATSSSVGGTLLVSDYISQDLSTVSSAFDLQVSTSTGASTLTVSSLATADQITIISGTSANLGSDNATSLTALQLGTNNLVVESGATLSLTESQAISLKEELTGTGSLILSEISLNNSLSGISTSLNLSGSLADISGSGSYSLVDAKLDSVDSLTIGINDSLDIASTASVSNLTALTLSSGASVTLASANLPSLVSFTGDVTSTSETINIVASLDTAVASPVTVGNFDSKLDANGAFVSSVTVNAINLESVASLEGIDSVVVGDTASTSVIRLSDALINSGKTTVNFAADNGSDDGTVDLLDFRYDTNSSDSFVGSGATGSWASHDLGFVTVNNFDPQVDSFGVYDTSGNALLTSINPTPSSSLNVTNGGIVAYNTQTDLDDISAVRNAIGSLVAEVTGSDSDGVATFGVLIKAGGRSYSDWALYLAEWSGANGAGSNVGNTDDLKVAPVAKFANWNVNETFTAFTADQYVKDYTQLS